MDDRSHGPKSRLCSRAAACLGALLLAAGCGRGASGDGTPGSMTLQVTQGTARLTRDTTTTAVRSTARIEAGDRIDMDGSAMATLSLAQGRVFELIGAGVAVSSGQALRLEHGKVLAELSRQGSVGIEGGQVAASSSDFRVDSALAIRAAAYKGTATITLAGEDLAVAAYRQAVVAGSVLPRSVQPLRFGGDDPWDRRFLQPALDLDQRLTNFGRGLEAQVAGTPVQLLLDQAVAGTAAFLPAYASSRRSDLLIGAGMAALAAKGAGRPLDDVFREQYGLWTAGATWGLIAQEYGVSGGDLFVLLEAAVTKAGLIVSGQGPAIARIAAPRPATPAPARGAGPRVPSAAQPAPAAAPAPASQPADLLSSIVGILPGPVSSLLPPGLLRAQGDRGSPACLTGTPSELHAVPCRR